MTDLQKLKGDAFVEFGATAKYGDARVEVSWEAFSAGWDALLDALDGDQHILKLDVSEDDTLREWTIQHPVTERLDGSLFNCPFTQAANLLVLDIHESGTYRLWKDRNALLWEPVD